VPRRISTLWCLNYYLEQRIDLLAPPTGYHLRFSWFAPIVCLTPRGEFERECPRMQFFHLRLVLIGRVTRTACIGSYIIVARRARRVLLRRPALGIVFLPTFECRPCVSRSLFLRYLVKATRVSLKKTWTISPRIRRVCNKEGNESHEISRRLAVMSRDQSDDAPGDSASARCSPLSIPHPVPAGASHSIAIYWREPVVSYRDSCSRLLS